MFLHVGDMRFTKQVFTVCLFFTYFQKPMHHITNYRSKLSQQTLVSSMFIQFPFIFPQLKSAIFRSTKGEIHPGNLRGEPRFWRLGALQVLPDRHRATETGQLRGEGGWKLRRLRWKGVGGGGVRAVSFVWGQESQYVCVYIYICMYVYVCMYIIKKKRT